MPQNITLKLDPPQKKKEHRQSSIKASPTGVLNGKLNIKKYYFGSFMFILHTPKEVLNKILNVFSLPQMLFLHIFQKSQNQQNGATKKINQLNVAMWKKNNIKLIKK